MVYILTVSNILCRKFRVYLHCVHLHCVQLSRVEDLVSICPVSICTVSIWTLSKWRPPPLNEVSVKCLYVNMCTTFFLNNNLKQSFEDPTAAIKNLVPLYCHIPKNRNNKEWLTLFQRTSVAKRRVLFFGLPAGPAIPGIWELGLVLDVTTMGGKKQV